MIMDRFERYLFYIEFELGKYKNIKHEDFEKFRKYIRLSKLQYKRFKKKSKILGIWEG